LVAGSNPGLADSLQESCSELAHGFTIEQLVELVRAGLATSTPQRIRAGGKTIRSPRSGSQTRGEGHWPKAK
jgi:hypothetical protein